MPTPEPEESKAKHEVHPKKSLKHDVCLKKNPKHEVYIKKKKGCVCGGDKDE